MSEEQKARAYQINAIDEIRLKFSTGIRSVLLWLSTGGGKTFCFSVMVKAAAAQGMHCLIVVRGRKLVDQASARLVREGVHHGVLMANHWNYRPYEKVQVCSIDTLIARGLKPPADLVILDEAHLFDRDSQAGEWVAHYKGNCFMVPVTATPYIRKGLRHLADAIVHPITALGLIEEGYLVKPRPFAPTKPDLKDVKVSSTKDYVNDQLEDAMVAGGLSGKIVSHWQKIAEGRPTLCFAVNVHHSKTIVAEFIAAGIPAEHCDADVPDSERTEIIKRLERGETKVVSNVGIFCTGVDIPPLGAVISARPTLSKNLFIQQCGRGTRPIYAEGFDLSTAAGRREAISASEKPNYILLDHAGNISRHGLPTDEVDVDLDGNFDDEPPTHAKRCNRCFVVYTEARCPFCPEIASSGGAFEIPEETDEVLTELKIEEDPVRRLYNQLKDEQKKKKHKSTWVYYRLTAKFSLRECTPYLPQYFIEKMEAEKREADRRRERAFAHSPYKPA